MSAAEFWKLCPVTLNRMHDAWLWRFRMEHGIVEERKASTPEAIFAAFQRMAVSDG